MSDRQWIQSDEGIDAVFGAIATPAESNNNKPMLVIVDGKPGTLQISPDDVILYEDVESSLLNSREDAQGSGPIKSGKKNYFMNRFGAIVGFGCRKALYHSQRGITRC